MGALVSKKRAYTIGGNDGKCSRSSSKQDDSCFIEKVVCRDDEMQDGSMAEFEIEDTKILLVKENGSYSALGTKCTHYGAPLKNGVLMNGTIRCPWHGACFNTKTGDIEDFPGLDSLPCYQVSVEDGNVKVKASADSLKSLKRIKPMVKHSHANPTTFVIVGGGAAGQMCAETLRQEGFTGKIVLITQENNLPYDRPKLSKALDSKATALYLRNEDFYKKSDISLMMETAVSSVDTKEKWVACKKGKLKVKYDSLMIATGGQPILFDIPGSDLKNVCYLRTPEDGNHIAKESIGKSVVIIGSSFIGMEVAAFLSSKAKSVTVIGRSPVPFAAVFGLEIGQRIKSMFDDKGVIFHNGKDVIKFIGNDGSVSGVELSSGETVLGDVCIVGIGVKPSTDFLKDSGIEMNDKGLIIVDHNLQTSVKDVYAGGDIVEFPLSTYKNIKANVCHWQMAVSHGHCAAINMVGKPKPFHSVPFFWSAMLAKSFRYAGYGVGFEEIIIKGDVENLQFIAYYIKGLEVVAVCTANKDPEAAEFASRISAGEVILKDEIELS